MRIELHFRYTIDDLRDALKPEERGSRRIKPSPRWQVITVSILVVPGLTAAFYFGWSRELRTADPLPPVRDLLFLMECSVVPALIVICAMLVSLRRIARLARRSSTAADAAALPKRHLFLAGLFSIASALGMLLIFVPGFAWPWEPRRAIAILIGVGPWVVAFAFLMAVHRLNRRRLVEIQWNARPTWRREKLYALDDDEGMLVRDEMAAATRRWPYFVRARETAISLLLHDEEGRVHIIPKRAFADDVEIARARWMIEQHVKSVEFQRQASAFAVVTAPAVGGAVDSAVGAASPTPPAEPDHPNN